MAKPSKIEVLGLGERVLTMAATMGSKRIANALRSEGIDVSFMSVQRYLEEHLQEREQATKQVKASVQEKLQEKILSDVEMLEKLRNELATVVFEDPPAAVSMVGIVMDPKTGKPVVDRSVWLRATKELRETLETRIKIAGADGDDARKVEVDLL